MTTYQAIPVNLGSHGKTVTETMHLYFDNGRGRLKQDFSVSAETESERPDSAETETEDSCLRHLPR